MSVPTSPLLDEANRTPTTFTFLGVPVKIKPAVLALLVPGWAAMAWLAHSRSLERSPAAALVVGGLYVLAAVPADAVHVTGHILSARYAGSPMDVVLVSADMPRTLYVHNDVPPRTHIARSIGGPVASGLALLTSLLLRRLAPDGSVFCEVMDVSCAAHGLIGLGALVPLPLVDGGVILKWLLVAKGRTPEAADEVVKGASAALGIAALAAGAAFTVARRWLPGLGLLAGGIVALAAASGRIR